jgi:hypothetical protein
MSIRRAALASVFFLLPVVAFAQNSSSSMYADAQTPGEAYGEQSAGSSSSGTGLFGQPDGAFSAGAKIGTLGIGGEVGYRPWQMFGVRIDGEAFSFDDNGIRVGRTNYNASANLQSYGALADLYPVGESFRITGGLRLNENELRGSATSVTTSILGRSTTIPVDDFGELGGKVTFNKLAPYLGFGWGGTLAPGLNITTDFGVMFQGNPKASVAAGLNSTGQALANSTFSAGLVNEYVGTGLAAEQAELQHYVNGYDFFPVIEIGLTYKF